MRSLLSVDGPVPISATVAAIGSPITVVFSDTLVARALNAGNWSVRRNNQLRQGSSMNASGSQVTGTTSAGVSDVGPDRIYYNPPPFDVEGAVNHGLTAAFEIPYTVV